MIFVNIYRVVQPSHNPISQPFYHPQKIPCAHPGLPFAGLQGAQPYSWFRGPSISLLPCTEIQKFHAPTPPPATNQRTQHPENKSQGSSLVSGLVRQLSSKTRQCLGLGSFSADRKKVPARTTVHTHQYLSDLPCHYTRQRGLQVALTNGQPLTSWSRDLQRGVSISPPRDSAPLFGHRTPDGHIMGSGEGEWGASLWHQSERKCLEVLCPSRPRLLLSVFPAPT